MSAQIAGCLDLERRTVTMSDFHKYCPKSIDDKIMVSSILPTKNRRISALVSKEIELKNKGTL